MTTEAHAPDASSVELRPATMEDSDFFFTLRCHPQIRQWMFDQSMPTIEGHLEWMRQKIVSPDSRLILIHAGGSPIGQLQVTRGVGAGGWICEVGIALWPTMQGKGCGSRALTLLDEVVIRWVDSCTLTAEILCNNLASINAFGRAGYVFMHGGVHIVHPYGVLFPTSYGWKRVSEIVSR